MKNSLVVWGVLLISITLLPAISASAATVAPPKKPHSKSRGVTDPPATQKKMARMQHSSRTTAANNKSTHSTPMSSGKKKGRKKYYEHFTGNSFASDQIDGDITAGEDPIVRGAAIAALGNMNGTVVSIDPDSGRVLAMVNQKLALSAGAQPCSTIKVAVALAALSENIITKDTEIKLGRYYSMDLTTALAHSNNAYFAAVGQQLGF